ncbi:MAG: glycosyltransferase family 4 protein [Chloroflexi bacterium]|nr:glycosyltransferase family 4 protein [Chloroflexota bacterium]
MRVCIIDRAAGFEQIPMRLGPLRRLGHQVDFIYSPWPQAHIRPYGRHFRVLAALNRWQLGHVLNKVLFSLVALGKLLWRHWRRSYNVVHIEEPLAAFLALLLPGSLRPVVVFSTMGPMPTEPQLSSVSPRERQRLLFRTLALPSYINVPARAMLAFNLRRASRAVVNSEALKAALVAMFGVDPLRVDVVHAGADTETFRPEADGCVVREQHGVERGAPLILAMGPVQPRKGQLKLLQALPLVLRRHPTTRVMLVGNVLSSSYEQALRRSVASRGLERHVIFAGMVPREELPQYYAAAGAVVMLSSAEGGVAEVLLEAMSCGRPCLASDIPNNRAAAPEGDEMLFVDPDDPEAVASAISGLLADPVRSAELGGNARRTILKYFHWDVLARDLVAVYERALAAGGGGKREYSRLVP